MKTLFISVMMVVASFAAMGADGIHGRYIEVNGEAQMEVVPDEIHYRVQLREYFTEEFDGKEPEEFRTRVSMQQLDTEFRRRLSAIGIADSAIRVVEVGDSWRKQGEQFYVSKSYDITLDDFSLIDKIGEIADRRAVEYMQIGELRCHDIDNYRRRCRVDALEAAHEKALYMAGALGAEIGEVLQIEEPERGGLVEAVAAEAATANVAVDGTGGYDGFRTISLRAMVRVRFALK